MAVKAPTTQGTQHRSLPASWKRAAGMLRRHKKSLEEHAKQMRAQWRGRYGA